MGYGVCRLFWGYFGLVLYLDSREVRWFAVVGSGLMGGDVTKVVVFV